MTKKLTPWSVTQDEWHDKNLDDVILRRKRAHYPASDKPLHPDTVHQAAVEKAMAEGLLVPDRVLADYPHLMRQPTPPAGWTVANEMTMNAFNQWGTKPYQAVYERQEGGSGQPVYDLTLLRHDNGNWLAAHGGVVMTNQCGTADEAAKVAIHWYQENNQPAYCPPKEDYYYYTKGVMGMKSDGSFTQERRHWMTFSRSDAERLNDSDTRPYGATMKGTFKGVERGLRLETCAATQPMDTPSALDLKVF